MRPPRHPIDHTPIRPPRATWWGEEAFHAAWQALMAEPIVVAYNDDDSKDRSQLANILDAIGVTPRRAAVAATFAVWLGCNGGRQILWRADYIRLTTSTRVIKYPTLFAWAQENVRVCGINGSLRISDAIFALPSDYGPDWLGRGNGINKQPEYSADDLEVIDRMCVWLDTAQGRGWVADAIRDAERRQKAYQDDARAKLNRDLGLSSEGDE